MTQLCKQRRDVVALFAGGNDGLWLEFSNVVPPDREKDIAPNVMAVWVICRALEVLDRISKARRTELTTRLGISLAEIARWEDISRRMYVPFHGDGITSVIASDPFKSAAAGWLAGELRALN